MTYRSACGIVLHIADYAESDKLVTLFCKELGRVTGIAKGAKKSKQRFVNKLEEFSCLRIYYRPPKNQMGLLFIAEAELLCSFLSLRKKYQRFVAAMYICELVLRFSSDNDADPNLFVLLQWALNALNEDHVPWKIATLFHLKLLSITGYRPYFDRCAGCQKNVSQGRWYTLVFGSGSLLCDLCTPRTLHGVERQGHLSVQTLKILENAQRAGVERLNRLQLSNQTAREALPALYQYTTHLLQHEVQSWQTFRFLLC